MMGTCLQVPFEEPDLVPASGDARVLVRGDHVPVSADVVGDTQYPPQQADLTGHGLLCCHPEERPDRQ